jgi:UDP-glucuronate 4-epimerase
MSQNVLVTGGAGFIGSHLVDVLLAEGHSVTVIDNFNSFYTEKMKRANIAQHVKNSRYRIIEGDVRDRRAVSACFAKGAFDNVIHLAAMAGVRPSLSDPGLYMDVNINGTQTLIDECLKSSRTRFILGSSSSVYGERSGESFLETDRVDQPLSPYAASKAGAELACYAAHHTRGLEVAALRFFTVYGPRQRPDLAIHKFCKMISSDQEIEIYGDGTSKRDYTFVSDIVSGITKSMTYDCSGFDIFNLGRSEPVLLMEMVRLLELALGKKAKVVHKDFQMGDVPYTFANIDKAKNLLDYAPSTKFEDGIKAFVAWYNEQNAVLNG